MASTRSAFSSSLRRLRGDVAGHPGLLTCRGRLRGRGPVEASSGNRSRSRPARRSVIDQRIRLVPLRTRRDVGAAGGRLLRSRHDHPPSRSDQGESPASKDERNAGCAGDNAGFRPLAAPHDPSFRRRSMPCLADDAHLALECWAVGPKVLFRAGAIFGCAVRRMAYPFQGQDFGPSAGLGSGGRREARRVCVAAMGGLD
jgi:hypothetical protein